METSPEIQNPPDALLEPAPPEAALAAEAAPVPELVEPEAAYDVWRELMRATQGWIQYGTLGFAVLCIIVGAVEALFGR